jgi:5-methylcytosine-specific restriction endonuclease McrA
MPHKDPEAFKLYQAVYRAGHKAQIAEKNRLWHEANRERRRVYYIEHRDVIKERSRQWRLNNPARALAKDTVYRETHRAERAAQKKAYIIASPDKVRIANARRRAHRALLPADLTVEQWQSVKRTYGFRCAYCGEKKPLTQDHIVPLSQGGPTVISNIVPACQSCNSKKHIKPPTIPLRIRML